MNSAMHTQCLQIPDSMQFGECIYVGAQHKSAIVPFDTTNL